MKVHEDVRYSRTLENSAASLLFFLQKESDAFNLVL